MMDSGTERRGLAHGAPGSSGGSSPLLLALLALLDRLVADRYLSHVFTLRLFREPDREHAVAVRCPRLLRVDTIGQLELSEEADGPFDLDPVALLFDGGLTANREHVVLQLDLNILRLDPRQLRRHLDGVPGVAHLGAWQTWRTATAVAVARPRGKQGVE